MGAPVSRKDLYEIISFCSFADNQIITRQSIIKDFQLFVGNRDIEVFLALKLFLNFGNKNIFKFFSPGQLSKGNAANKNEPIECIEKLGQDLYLLQKSRITSMHQCQTKSIKYQSGFLNVLVPSNTFVEHESSKESDIGNQQPYIDICETGRQ